MALETKNIADAIPQETLDWFGGDELRSRVFFEKYALRAPSGKQIETIPEQMWHRLAHEMASVETTDEKRKEWEENFFWALQNWQFIPAGRILFAAGQYRKSTANNCYVIPIKEDSLEGIFDWCKEAALTYSRGGGVGTDISILRPRHAPVSNSAIESTGAVSFMNLFSTVTGTIGQAARRGALLISIDISHPDVVEFIEVKSSGNLDMVRFANVSVKVTDEFMRAVENNSDFTFHFENEKVKVNKIVRARDIWDKIIKSAWKSAEPGVLFFDTIKRMGTTEYAGLEVISTNPCIPENTLILGDNLPIQSLQSGGHVFGGNGKLNLISNVTKRPYSGDMVHIKPKYLDSLICTPEHPIKIVKKKWLRNINGGQRAFLPPDRRVINPEWTESQFVEKGDYVLIPRLKPDPVETKSLDLIPYSSYKLTNGQIEEIKNIAKTGVTSTKLAREFGVSPRYIRTLIKNDRTNAIRLESFPLNEDTAWFLGLYVAEGCVWESDKSSGAYLCFVLNRDETSYENRIRSLMKTFGYHTTTYPNKHGRDSMELRIWCQSLARALKEWCGNGAKAKQIPDFIMSASDPIKIEFLRGLFSGDGGINHNQSTLFTSSKKLGLQTQLLLASFGCLTGMSRRGPRDVYLKSEDRIIHQDESWAFYSSTKLMSELIGYKRDSKPCKQTSYLVTDDFILTPVIQVNRERYSGHVYNIGTSDNTYLVNNAIVHNCGEEPLGAYDCCCLGNVNFSAFVLHQFTENAVIDWESLNKTIGYATRFLDNTLDYNADRHALADQRRVSLWGRRIGVGVTGLGDCLIKLGLKYDTSEAISFVDKLMENFKLVVYNTSVDLAREKGVFPAFDKTKHMEQSFIKALPEDLKDRIRDIGLRNSAIETIPPCGSISILAGVSAGVEPEFSFSYKRRSHSLSQKDFEVRQAILNEYALSGGNPDKLPDYFVSAHKVDPFMRIKMQGAIQKHIDAAISSTLNLPQDVSVETVEKIYFAAWRAGLKGVTIYREGSREGILETNDFKKKSEPKMDEHGDFARPKVLSGKTVKLRMVDGSLYVTLNSNGKPREVFITLGKHGDAAKADSEAIGRLISLYLQTGGSVQNVIKSLKNIQGGAVSWDSGLKLLSVPDAIAKALGLLTGQPTVGVGDSKPVANVEISAPKLENCPQCGEESVIESGGCKTCQSCGYSKCQ